MWAGVYKLVNDVLTFAGPILLYLIINFVQDPQEPTYYGKLYLPLFYSFFKIRLVLITNS